MNDEALEHLLRQGEDSTTEFKGVVQNRYRADPTDLAKAIAALANTRGGLLLLGVEDDGTVTGTGTREDTDALMRQVTQVCQHNIAPPLICSVTKRELRGESLLLVEVPAYSTSRPHRAGSVFYVRDANRSREASREELIRLLQSTDYHFDEQPVTGATPEDLDRDAVREFIASAYRMRPAEDNLTQYLLALKCIDRKGVPTVSGLLFFGREPTRWLLDARVSAVRISGTQISRNFLDRQEFEGRLLEQLEQASAFILRNIPAPSHVEGLVRVEEGLPREVVREAMVNALVHRDYRVASQIRVSVFDDRVEITNPGELLNQLNLDNIRQGGISQRRNPVLASLSEKARRSENLGFGIPEMIRALHELGFKEPSIELVGAHFRLTLWLGRGGSV
jgi:ATP-dependent DNA helicase RecG